MCDEANGWMPDLDDIRRKITPATKGIVVINLNNPTGALYSDELLKEIVAIARQHGLVILADEVYDKVLYDGVKHTAIASLSEDVLTLTFNSLSKSYRSCGYRAGWMVSGDKKAAADYIEGLTMLSNMRLCANVPGQWAIQTALGGYQSINELVAPGGRLRQRDLAYELITAIPGVTCVKPQAALYMFPRLDPQGLPDPGRPPVLPGTAAGDPRDAGAGHRLQLAQPGPLPHRLPAARGRPARGRRPHRALPRQLPQASFEMKPIQVGLLGMAPWAAVSSTSSSATRPRSSAAPAAASASPWSPTSTLRAPRPSGGNAKVVKDAREIINNPEIDIVIELIGGYGIARQLAMEAIAHGKHVVTANKALLACTAPRPCTPMPRA